MRTRVALRLLTLLALICGVFYPISVKAYDNDTHYYLTFYLARIVGYTPMQAFRIASADVGIDYAEETEPIQAIDSVQAQHDAVQDRRTAFHAFQDLRIFGRGHSEAGQAAIRRWDEILWDRAIALNNPGVFLHYDQDTFSHDPDKYDSLSGHLRDGHAPDFLSFDTTKAEGVARRTIERLAAFMRECCSGQRPRAVNFEVEVRPVLNALIAASPAPSLSESNRGKLRDQIPDMEAAYRIIQKALSHDPAFDSDVAISRGETSSPVPHMDYRGVFEFDAAGSLPPSARDRVVVSGTLFLKIVDHEDKPLGGATARLVLEPNPDGSGGSVLLDRSEGSDTNGELTLLDKPVGRYRIIVSHPRFISQPVEASVDRRHNEVTVTLRPRDETSSTRVVDEPGTLQVEVIDIDSGREPSSVAVTAVTALSDGSERTYDLRPAIPAAVLAGFYSVTATTSAGETDSTSVNIRSGANARVRLSIGRERSEKASTGIDAILREVEELRARREDLVESVSRSSGVKSALEALREADAEADSLMSRMDPMWQICRALDNVLRQPDQSSRIETLSRQVERSLLDGQREARSCRGPESIEAADKALTDAASASIAIELHVGAVMPNPDVLSSPASVIAAGRPLLLSSAPAIEQLGHRLAGESDARDEDVLVHQIDEFNAILGTRKLAMLNRLQELAGLASSTVADPRAELDRIAAARGEVQGLMSIDSERLSRLRSNRGVPAELRRLGSKSDVRRTRLRQLSRCGVIPEGLTRLKKLDEARTTAALALATLGEQLLTDTIACRDRLEKVTPSSTSGTPATPNSAGPTPDKLLEEVVVVSRSITVTVWDAQCEDGDSITVRVGGQPVFNNHTLTNARTSRTITLSSNSSDIEIFANSSGTDCPPGRVPPDQTVNSGAVEISGAAAGGQQEWVVRKNTSTKARISVDPSRTAVTTTPATTSGVTPSSLSGIVPGINLVGTRVTSVGGSVTSQKGETTTALAKDQTLLPGTTVRTGAGSSATIGGSSQTVKVEANTSVHLPSPPGKLLKLSSGAVDVSRDRRVARLEGEPSFDGVETTEGTITDTETRYVVRKSPDQTHVEVFEGTVHLEGNYILKLASRGQQEIGKRGPARELDLVAGERAILLRVGSAPTSVKSASPSSPLPATLTGRSTSSEANAAGPVVAPPTTERLPGFLTGTSSPPPPAVASGDTSDAWMGPQVQRLIDEWLGIARPAASQATSRQWRYSDWGVPLAPGAVAAGPPDHPAGWTRHQTVWSVRDRLDSVNACTLGEFVSRRLAGRSLEGCDKGVAPSATAAAVPVSSRSPAITAANIVGLWRCQLVDDSRRPPMNTDMIIRRTAAGYEAEVDGARAASTGVQGNRIRFAHKGTQFGATVSGSVEFELQGDRLSGSGHSSATGDGNDQTAVFRLSCYHPRG